MQFLYYQSISNYEVNIYVKEDAFDLGKKIFIPYLDEIISKIDIKEDLSIDFIKIHEFKGNF